MRATLIVFGLSCALAAQSENAVVSLTFDGYGLITFGMTIADAVRVLGQPRIRINVEGDESCYYARFEAYPDVRFMIEDGRVVRAEPPDKSYNVLGLKIGMRLVEVRKQFKERDVPIQEYDDDGHRLVFKSPNGKVEILAEVSQGVITDIRGGLLPAVEYVEGCL
jgi:hypothetical protein